MMTSKQQVPVLMYHALSQVPLQQTRSIHISVKLFLQQLQWLAENNYRSININEMMDAFAQKKNLSNCCIISFDDGYFSLYKYAMPMLKAHNFTATLYLTTGAVDKKNFDAIPYIAPATFPAGEKPLTWKQIKEMQDHGWSIQSHSVTHADNSKLTPTQFSNEIMTSKNDIEQQLQQPVKHYAFPFGKYNAASAEILKACGYDSAATVHSGLCTEKNDPYRLPRLEINSNDELAVFSRKIKTGFGSSKEKVKAAVRNVVFKNLRVKDLLKK